MYVCVCACVCVCVFTYVYMLSMYGFMPHWIDHSKMHELANVINWQTVGLLLSRTVVYGLWFEQCKKKEG